MPFNKWLDLKNFWSAGLRLYSAYIPIAKDESTILNRLSSCIVVHHRTMSWFQYKEFLIDASRHERNEGERRENDVRDEGVDHSGKRGCNSEIRFPQKEKKIREQLECGIITITQTYIKPSVTSSTLSLRANSMNFVKIFRTPRLTLSAALSKAIVSVDNQGLSFGIWGFGVSRCNCKATHLLSGEACILA
jgi:hypothetical protein